MHRDLRKLKGYSIHETDGEIGNVHDFYFDDRLWIIRYLVAETGGWLSNQHVLISSAALKQPIWEKKILPVSLTKEQVRNSPKTNMHMPIDLEHEYELHMHYGWSPYWGLNPSIEEIALIAEVEHEAMVEVEEEQEEKQKAEEGTKKKKVENSHLRSIEVVSGYHIHANDGQIGHVADFVVEDENWAIRYIVVETQSWLAGKKVLISPHWIEKMSWSESEIYVNLLRENIKNSPEFDPSAPVNRDYEDKLYDYYGRRKYWTEDAHAIGSSKHVPQ